MRFVDEVSLHLIAGHGGPEQYPTAGRRTSPLVALMEGKAERVEISTSNPIRPSQPCSTSKASEFSAPETVCAVGVAVRPEGAERT